MAGINHLADQLKASLSTDEGGATILLGYSGGLDSSVLLYAAARAFPPARLLAVHCDHGIGNSASAWADHCRKQAKNLGIRIVVDELGLGKNASEAMARKARYQCFTDHMQTFTTPLLLLGHHADDQIETFLFRLFRGSGLRGLSAMPRSRNLGGGRLLRPLLGVSKSSLYEIAIQEGISWIEDDSNANDDVDRNFIRNRVLPLIGSRWPDSGEKMLHARAILNEADILLEEYAELLINSLEPRQEVFGQSFSIPKLQSLSVPQRRLVLRCQISAINAGTEESGHRLRNADIEEIEVQFFNSKPDSAPEFRAAGAELRRFRNRLYILRRLPEVGGAGAPITWDSRAALHITGVGKLTLLEGNEEQFEVKFRRGSERARPVSRTHSQSLKKLMQESDIEPWLRSRIPLVFLGDELVGVGDRIQCADYKFKWQWQEV